MSPIMGLLPGRPTESLRSRLRRDRPDPVGRTSQIHRNPRTTDGVDRPARQLDPEQLARELARVAAGDTVPDRERHDRSLQPWPKRRPRHLAGKLGARLGRATGTADTVQPMLAHPDGGRRQLRELVSPRLRHIDALPYAERVRAR